MANREQSLSFQLSRAAFVRASKSAIEKLIAADISPDETTEKKRVWTKTFADQLQHALITRTQLDFPYFEPQQFPAIFANQPTEFQLRGNYWNTLSVYEVPKSAIQLDDYLRYIGRSNSPHIACMGPGRIPAKVNYHDDPELIFVEPIQLPLALPNIRLATLRTAIAFAKLYPNVLNNGIALAGYAIESSDSFEDLKLEYKRRPWILQSRNGNIWLDQGIELVSTPYVVSLHVIPHELQQL